MINFLKKLKTSVLKTVKFCQNSNNVNFLQAISFFNLRFFYSSPFFRKFFKVNNDYPNENKKLYDDYFGLKIDQGLVISDLLNSGISQKYFLENKVIEKLIRYYVENENKIENLDLVKKKTGAKKLF